MNRAVRFSVGCAFYRLLTLLNDRHNLPAWIKPIEAESSGE